MILPTFVWSNGGVHTDVHTLLGAGLLRKTGDDRIVFPYDAIHVDFTLRAA